MGVYSPFAAVVADRITTTHICSICGEGEGLGGDVASLGCLGSSSIADNYLVEPTSLKKPEGGEGRAGGASGPMGHIVCTPICMPALLKVGLMSIKVL